MAPMGHCSYHAELKANTVEEAGVYAEADASKTQIWVAKPDDPGCVMLHKAPDNLGSLSLCAACKREVLFADLSMTARNWIVDFT